MVNIVIGMIDWAELGSEDDVLDPFEVEDKDESEVKNPSKLEDEDKAVYLSTSEVEDLSSEDWHCGSRGMSTAVGRSSFLKP